MRAAEKNERSSFSNSNTSSSLSNYSLYRVNSGPFTVYTNERYNSFGATATWANTLGYSGLKSIYDQYTNGSNGYQNYAAWEMFNDYCAAWSFNELNR